MPAGPVFDRELVISARRPRLFFIRSLYVTALLLLVCTAWLVITGTQVVRTVGDMARFGSILFTVLAPLQLALMAFFSAFSAAAAVAQEKDRRTLLLLLMTRMGNHELVLGKLLASLLNVLVMIVAALPLFTILLLFGGVSIEQVLRVFLVTLAVALASGSVGSTIALWREKTFQSLALTALAIILWIGFWEAAYALGSSGLTDREVLRQTAAACSPVRAILTAARPDVAQTGAIGILGGIGPFLLIAVGVILSLNAVAILFVRRWNPSREVRRQSRDDNQQREEVAEDEAARSAHVDSRERQTASEAIATRHPWDNPVLWREMCTWAYGRKVVFIRIVYALLVVATAVLLWGMQSGDAQAAAEATRTAIPAVAQPLVPFFMVSLVILNALAVTSITGERDGQALDLLLATDLKPKEIVFGKLLGVMYVAKETIIAPLIIAMILWLLGGISTENYITVTIGLLVMDLFVAVLGIHTGMTYANSRSAIGVSLGTVFFLFLGVATCILMMISFSGSFQAQLAPFLALILGGGVGLYVSLGAKNPSAAIGLASLLVPFATFYAITSFLLQHHLAAFLVTIVAYGFTTAALLIPAIYEFDVEMGRTSGGE